MQNWARPSNFDILFCVSFEHQYQKLISGMDTGRKFVYLPNSKIFQSFPTLRKKLRFPGYLQ